jgi:hypothetical protein
MTGPGDFTDMLPAELEQAAHRLGVHARELSDGWPKHESAIAGRESAIGNDVVGAAFRGVYDREMAVLKGNARAVIELLGRDADAGTKSAGHYATAELRSMAGFEGLEPPGTFSV